MCECLSGKNVVDLQRYKIYTIMADYKVKDRYRGSISSITGFGYIGWSNASQEQLAYLYEELKQTSFIDKLEQYDEKEETVKSEEISVEVNKTKVNKKGKYKSKSKGE